MSTQPLRRRVEAGLWQHSQVFRRPLRGLKRTASIALHRLRGIFGDDQTPRVLVRPSTTTRTEPLPLVGLVAPDTDPTTVARFRSSQTETSITTDPDEQTPFLFMPAENLADLPATHIESMVMAAVAEDLDQVAAGWSTPADGRHGPSGVIHSRTSSDPTSHILLRRPAADRQGHRPVMARSLSHICSPSHIQAAEPLDLPGVRSGPYQLHGGSSHGSTIRSEHHSLAEGLASLAAEPGPPTALFLLPYLAVGGAERLLYDLLWGLSKRYRLLIVTLEPHLASLGQTLDVCRDLTPHVYSLGDWLPREAHFDGLRHLIRRWSVQTLVSWNGTVAFYDRAAKLRAEFPELRILNQIYNHRGAWIKRTTPGLIRAVDCHIAVNGRIAEALESEWAVPANRIATIHHAVEVPEPPAPPEVERRKRARRRELGIPAEAVVVGTFARMHPQKRPLDVIRLASRMVDRNVHFLLVGGGPMDGAVDREIQRHPHHNLTRLPLRHDTDTLMDAVDICLLPSQYEGLPVFLLEGMARQVPCVATAVGDIPMLLERGGGLVSGPPGDLGALEAAIESLIDDHRRATEGERALRRVKARFGLDRYVREYEAVIFPREGGHALDT